MIETDPHDPSRKLVDDAFLARLSSAAAATPRRRLNHNLHESADDPIQRMLNAMEPDSYVRPHVHPDKWEMLVAIRGAFDVLLFDTEGVLRSRHRLEAGTRQATRPLAHGFDALGRVLEYPAGAWHTLVSLEPGSVFLEVKPGPWVRTAPHEFASWAPAEGDPDVGNFVARLAALHPGECA